MNELRQQNDRTQLKHVVLAYSKGESNRPEVKSNSGKNVFVRRHVCESTFKIEDSLNRRTTQTLQWRQ